MSSPHKENPPFRQLRYLDALDDYEWRRAVRGLPEAGVLHEADPAARDVIRAVPDRADIVRVGRAGMIVGYKVGRSPTSARREFQFRLFRATELARLGQWRRKAGIPLQGDAWAIAVASVAEPNAASVVLETLCPELSPGMISEAIEHAAQTGARFTAQQLGDLIGLTVEEREGLDIRSMRPAGMTGKEFCRYARERSRDKGRNREMARRRAAGAMPRRRGETAREEAEGEGVSVATIYRRRRKAKASAPPCEATVRHDYRERYSTRSPVTAPAWLLRAFEVAIPIAVNDPGAPPNAARLGEIVGRHTAALRAAGRAA